MIARQRSHSPEVNLSSLDFGEKPEDLDNTARRGTPSVQFSDPTSHTRVMHSHRAASPWGR